MKKIIGFIAVLMLLSSCATTQRYPNSISSPQKSEKLAYLEYEMARNIILHKDYSRLPEAFKHLNNARNVLEDDPRIYYMIALAYKLRNDSDKYVAYLNESIKKDKNFFDAYNALGIYYYEKKEYQKAIDTFSKLIHNPLYPHADFAFFNRSRVYIKLKKYKKAENDMRSALLFSGYRNRIYWQNLISIQIEEKKYQEALKSLNKMEIYTGASDFTHYSKALCYTNLSMFEKAKKELQHIKESNPDYYALKNRLLEKINAHHSNN